MLRHQDCPPRALDLTDPPAIDRTHAEHAVDELDRRRPGERRADRELPREVVAPWTPAGAERLPRSTALTRMVRWTGKP